MCNPQYKLNLTYLLWVQHAKSEVKAQLRKTYGCDNILASWAYCTPQEHWQMSLEHQWN